ncbi:hypothetical protein WR25_21363 [Diploscapter pachys]|uniref:Uncharacterized protein n=1 Tax=Diploscapter pachys TaxID=2018661 RepID=A0A2A2JJ89_9BILA|nr:hypothetical protein WR25_21363 [Diploscapter pachys]
MHGEESIAPLLLNCSIAARQHLHFCFIQSSTHFIPLCISNFVSLPSRPSFSFSLLESQTDIRLPSQPDKACRANSQSPGPSALVAHFSPTQT